MSQAQTSRFVAPPGAQPAIVLDWYPASSHAKNLSQKCDA